jgi:hypothetical protein
MPFDEGLVMREQARVSMGQAATRTSAAYVVPLARDGFALIATDVSAAKVAKRTQDHSAGRNPAVTAAGSLRLPWAEKTALAIAMAKTAPKRCAM